MNDHLTILQNHFLFRGAEELLPEAVSGEAPLPGTLATLFGFWVMMLLDVALG